MPCFLRGKQIRDTINFVAFVINLGVDSGEDDMLKSTGFISI